MPIIDLRPSEDREGGLKRLEHVRPRTPFAGHARHQLKDGRIIHVEIIGRHQRFQGRLASSPSIRTSPRSCEAELRHRALYDPLTGLVNRTLFRDRVEHALATGAREMTSGAVLLLALERFKVDNDTLGHAAGDEIIVAVAQRLRGSVRPGDTPAHIGGDEFAVLLPSADSRQASRAAERILQALRAPVDVAGAEVFTSASIGVAIHAGFGGDLGEEANVDRLLSRADVAMCTAKSRGRGGFHSMSPPSIAPRCSVWSSLPTCAGVQREEFYLEYQPVVALADNSAGRVEALIRWQHPERGLIPPVDFITG